MLELDVQHIEWPRWISRAFAVPAQTDHYLVVYNCAKAGGGISVDIAYFDITEVAWHMKGYDDPHLWITHWLPLPPAPKEEA